MEGDTTDNGCVKREKPEHIDFAEENRRLTSFKDYAHNFPDISITKLAKAGFFYTGNTDSVICFLCGGKAQCWQRGDDPFTEHRRLFPNCGFIALLESEFGEKTVNEPPLDTEACLEEVMAEPAVQDAMNMNESHLVKSACRLHICRSYWGDKKELTGERLGILIKEIENSPNLQKHYGDMNNEIDCNSDESDPSDCSCNTSLEADDDKKPRCGCCGEDTGDILNIPCGHLFCNDCTYLSPKCLDCGKNIVSNIKVKLTGFSAVCY